MTKPLPHRITFTREQAEDVRDAIQLLLRVAPYFPEENLVNVRDRLERLLKKMDKIDE